MTRCLTRARPGPGGVKCPKSYITKISFPSSNDFLSAALLSPISLTIGTKVEHFMQVIKCDLISDVLLLLSCLFFKISYYDNNLLVNRVPNYSRLRLIRQFFCTN